VGRKSSAECARFTPPALPETSSGASETLPAARKVFRTLRKSFRELPKTFRTFRKRFGRSQRDLEALEEVPEARWSVFGSSRSGPCDPRKEVPGASTRRIFKITPTIRRPRAAPPLARVLFSDHRPYSREDVEHPREEAERMAFDLRINKIAGPMDQTSVQQGDLR
jgi:hypothetical protein